MRRQDPGLASRHALGDAPHATIAISGGTTPKLMFAELAKARFDWSKVHLFWVDERGVPPNDPQSNYKLAKESFLDPAHFPSQNVHRIQAETRSARRGAALRRRDPQVLRHRRRSTAGLRHHPPRHGRRRPHRQPFPGEPLIDDHTNIAAAVYVEKFHQWRITLLPGVLEAAQQTIMLVAGEDKAEPLKSVLQARTIPRNSRPDLDLRRAQRASGSWIAPRRGC